MRPAARSYREEIQQSLCLLQCPDGPSYVRRPHNQYQISNAIAALFEVLLVKALTTHSSYTYRKVMTPDHSPPTSHVRGRTRPTRAGRGHYLLLALLLHCLRVRAPTLRGLCHSLELSPFAFFYRSRSIFNSSYNVAAGAAAGAACCCCSRMVCLANTRQNREEKDRLLL